MSKTFKFFVFIVFLISLADAISEPTDIVKITIKERGSILSFYDEYFVVNINGTITATNPTSLDVYFIAMPLRSNTLQLNLNGSYTSGFYQDSGGNIRLTRLTPNSTITTNFRLYGITTDKAFKDAKDGLLYDLIKKDEVAFDSLTTGTLYKAPLEDTSKGGHEHTRLISAKYKNPTSVPFYINNVRIIKTAGLDLNKPLNTWEFKKENNILKAGEVWNIDVYDKDAYGGEIYWLSADVTLSNIYLESFANNSFFTQNDLFIINESNSTLSENTSISPVMPERVFLRKTISNNVVNPGDVIDVVMLINNFNPQDIDNVNLTDTFPKGFKVYDSKKGKTIGNKIFWTNITLNAKETRRLSYSLKYIDNESIGMDFFDAAMLNYKNKIIYSQTIPFIRKYIPEKKLFVQKKIEYLSQDQVRVTIILKNMGEGSIEQLVVNEFLSSNSEFKEISKKFYEKGIWKIDKIKPGEEWEVSYVTDVIGVLNSFPIVYGLPEKDVMKTIILTNVIETEYKNSKFNFMEGIGLTSIIVILVLLLLAPTGIFKRTRNKIEKVKSLDKDLNDLLVKSKPHETPLNTLHKTTSPKETSPATIAPTSDNNPQHNPELQKKVEETKKKIAEIKKKTSR
jgi:hypothetical protein